MLKRWLLVIAPLTLALVFAAVSIAGCGGGGLPALRLYVSTGSIEETADTTENTFTVTVKLPYGEAGPVVVVLSAATSRLIITDTTTAWEEGTQLVVFTIETIDNLLIDGNEVVTFQASADGYADSNQLTVTVLDDDGLPLTLNIPSDATEGFAVPADISGAVTIPETSTLDVVVLLSSGNPNRLSVPASATIAAGDTSASFTMVLDDNSVVELVDPETINITASAAGYAPGTNADIIIFDNDGNVLTLIIPSDATEGFADPANISGTVIIPEAISWDVVVALSSDGPDRLSTPASVVITAGETYANFTMTLLNNSIVDTDPDPVIITASSTGYTSDNDTINLHDNDGLVVTFAGNPVAENAGAVGGTVTVSRVPVADLIVTLTSSDTTAAAVQTQAVIVAPAISAAFQAFPLDNLTYDGDTFTVITASASNYEDASSTLFITDND